MEIKAWQYQWRLSSKIREERGIDNRRGEWGVLVITNDGLISIVGDYENGIHHAPFPSERELYGNDFRRWILDSDDEYLVRKMYSELAYKRASETETAKNAIYQILEKRRRGELSHFHARYEYSRAKELMRYRISLDEWFEATEMFDCFDIIQEYTESVKCVQKYLWPEFKRMIREELECERKGDLLDPAPSCGTNH